MNALLGTKDALAQGLGIATKAAGVSEELSQHSQQFSSEAQQLADRSVEPTLYTTYCIVVTLDTLLPSSARKTKKNERRGVTWRRSAKQ